MTQRLCSALSLLQGTSTGTPRLRAKESRSFCMSLKLSVCHGFTAPAARLFVVSGTTRSQSMPMVRPNPRQVSQAPMGELNEKVLGTGSL